MSKNRYINTTFWKDNYVVDLDPSEKLLFLYLLTNPYTNIVGIYEISLREISFDTGFDKDMVLKILERFKKDEKIIYINGYIYLINFLKHQKFNPSSKKGAEKIIGEIKKSFWLELEENNKLYRACIEALTYYNINSNINYNNNININSNSDFEKSEEISKEISTLKNKKSFQDLLNENFSEEFLEKIKENYEISSEQLKQEGQNFILYWTEKNPNGKKEKWEMEKTFDIQRRFYKWVQNDKKWNNKKNNYESGVVFAPDNF